MENTKVAVNDNVEAVPFEDTVDTIQLLDEADKAIEKLSEVLSLLRGRM